METIFHCIHHSRGLLSNRLQNTLPSALLVVELHTCGTVIFENITR